MDLSQLDRSAPPNVVGDIAACVPDRDGHIVREYLHYAARATHAPPRYHIGAILPGLAHLLVMQGWKIDVGEGSPKYPQILTGLIGTSGSAKSTAAKLARKTIQSCTRQLYQGDAQEDPFLVADGSPQGIFHALAAFYRPELEVTPAVAWQDEFSLLLRREDFADMLCRIYDGEDLKRHLRAHQREVKKGERKAGDEDVKAPILSGIFASTPDSMAATTTAAHIGGGLFSRVAWQWESLDAEHLLYEVPDTRMHRAHVEVLLHKWWIALRAEQMVSPVLKRDPVIRFSPEANDLIREYVWTPVRYELSKESRLGALFTRLVRLTKFIAGIYALTGMRFGVGAEEAHAAVHMAQAYMRSLYRLDGQLAQSDEAKAMNTIETIVYGAGKQGIQRYLLLRTLRGIPKFDRDKAIWSLLDSATIHERKIQTTGRPAVTYFHSQFGPPES